MSSKSDNKKIAKNTIILNLRLLATILIGLYSSRLVLKVLGVEDYGLYSLVGGFVSMLSIVTTSITGAISRFITVEIGRGDFEKLKIVVCSVFNVLAVLSIFVAIVAAVIGPWFIENYLNVPSDKLDLAIVVYFFSVIVFILNILAIPYSSLVNAHEHMSFLALMSIYDSTSRLIIIFGLQYFGQDKLMLFSGLLAIAALINRIVYSIYCNKHFKESKYHFVYDKDVIRSILSFSVWMGVGSIAGILKDHGGNILVNIFFGLTLNAAYGIANQISHILSRFGTSIGLAISPQITKSYSSGNINRAIKLTYLYSKCEGIFMLFIVVPILTNTDYLLQIWLDEVPQYAVTFTQLISIVTFFHILSMSFGPLYLANGNIRNYQIFMSCVNILYLPICYFLLSEYHNPYLCLIVSIGLELFFVFANFICISFLLEFNFKFFLIRVLFPLFITAVLSVSVTYLVGYIDLEFNVCRLMLNTMVSIITICLISILFMLDVKEKTYLYDIILSKIHFLKLKR